MELTIKAGVLSALTNLSGKKDIRYYLNGVLVEVKDNTLRLVATDGHVMGIYQQELEEPSEAMRLVIPNEVIAKLDKKTTNVLICDQDQWRADNINFAPIDGQYPDYMRVLPAKISGEVAQFNPDFIARFAKVAKALSSKFAVPIIAHNGTSGALVDIGMPLNFVGIMMPIRTDAPMPSVPVWLKPAIVENA